MVHDKERYGKEFSISSERSERIPEAVTRKLQGKNRFLGNIVTSAFPELSQGDETRGILKIRQGAYKVVRGWNGSEEPDNVAFWEAKEKDLTFYFLYW